MAARDATPRLFSKSSDQTVLFSTRSTPISAVTAGSRVTVFTSLVEVRHPISPPHPIYRKTLAWVLPRTLTESIFPTCDTQIETSVRVVRRTSVERLQVGRNKALRSSGRLVHVALCRNCADSFRPTPRVTTLGRSLPADHLKSDRSQGTNANRPPPLALECSTGSFRPE